VSIEPFELNDIQPDTVMIQDIHLKNNDYVDTAVENNHSPRNNTLTLINYPNPFNTSTNFFVQLPDGMKRKAGDISIYNMRGELIITIPFKNGASVRWDGKDRNGNVMPSGIFYYQLTIEQQRMKTGSMILLK
jgi:flagellar hook assembly protein FlgD